MPLSSHLSDYLRYVSLHLIFASVSRVRSQIQQTAVASWVLKSSKLVFNSASAITRFLKPFSNAIRVQLTFDYLVRFGNHQLQHLSRLLYSRQFEFAPDLHLRSCQLHSRLLLKLENLQKSRPKPLQTRMSSRPTQVGVDLTFIRWVNASCWIPPGPIPPWD